jgi:hypothetical protein
VFPILIFGRHALDVMAAAGISEDEVQEAFDDPDAELDLSRLSDRPLVKGHTRAGRYLVAVYEEQDNDPLRLFVVTVFAPEET